MQEELGKIVILGGGTAGWLAAAALSKALAPLNVKIVLVESEEIGAVGVGEATIPPIVNFIKYLGIDEAEFMHEVSATYKLAIKFTDWYEKGESYWHPFGSVGLTLDGQSFHDNWLNAKKAGLSTAYTDYSPAVHLCNYNNFYDPNKAPEDSFLAGASYAWQFDAIKVARYMRGYAEKKGVQRVEGIVESAIQAPSGDISALKMLNGTEIHGDFFIDCSGTAGVLIDKVLGVPLVDWSDNLPCDRAVTCQTKSAENWAPYTTSVARDAGWTWEIPLQNRVGNGYVYSSVFCDDETAQNTLLQSISGEIITEPKFISFSTGRRENIWYKNCLSLGLSSGFVEPLESTAIHLVMKGVRTFVDLLPKKTASPVLANEYNRLMNSLYDDVRDFVILHYCTSNRTDSEFWRHCKNMVIPGRLKERIELYREEGRLYHNPEDLFKPPSWHAVFDGMHVHPLSYNPFVNNVDVEEIKGVLGQVNGLMDKMAKGLPPHKKYVQELLKKR